MTEKHEVDLLVIGSGIYGIQAARTYLEIHPNDQVIILESGKYPGGVWGAERMYDEFWTQTPLETSEFSDEPLKSVTFKDTYHGYFPARYVTEYLARYIESHRYAGKSLSDRIVYSARVSTLKKSGNWHATINEAKSVYIAGKVIDASGLASIPNIPQLPGKTTFRGQLIHHKEFGRSNVLDDSSGRSLIVIGGAKSAADVAYAAAKAGKKVSWVIRKSGSGPAAFSPTIAPVRLYRNSNEAFHNRLMGIFATSIFSDASGCAQRFIHNTAVGRWILKKVWATMQKGIGKLARYNRPEGLDNGFANLKPDTTIFWENDSSGVAQRQDFYDMIARHVKVYRQDVVRVSANELVLAGGTRIEADVIVLATGWKHSTPYLEPATAAYLGLSAPVSAFDSKEAAKWQDLEEKADKNVIRRFPVLAERPPYRHHKTSESPFRLYKAILPIHDHSIAFLGKLVLGNNFYSAEVQALYAVAALDETIALPSPPAMEEEVAHVVAWNRRRYLAKGERGSWFYWDLVPYTDSLLKELGLSSHRKAGWRDMLMPALAPDLRGLISEYKSQRFKVD